MSHRLPGDANIGAEVAALQTKIKEAGDKVKTLKADKKPKDDPDLVAALAELSAAKAELAELTKPVETNPFAKVRAELDDVCKRRFFYRPAFDIYGGTAGFYTYGPPGSALKANITALWRKHFIIEENLMEIEDPTITPHDVLKTSGHVDRFNDFMVKDSKHEDKFYRADKLLEGEMETRLKVPTITEAERTQYKKDLLAADSFSGPELGAKLKEYGIKAPDTGNDLTDPYPFNLMFPTPIGPSGLLQGYLRPETAQGIFLNYKYCAEQNAEKMPFGVAQIGKSYRNEIAPRGGLVRQREFTQAEIEFFCRPKNKDFEKFKSTGVDKLCVRHAPVFMLPVVMLPVLMLPVLMVEAESSKCFHLTGHTRCGRELSMLTCVWWQRAQHAAIARPASRARNDKENPGRCS